MRRWSTKYPTMVLFAINTIPPDQHRSHLREFYSSHSSCPPHFPTLWCDAQSIRMIRSSVMIFLLVFACYLTSRLFDNSLSDILNTVNNFRAFTAVPIINPSPLDPHQLTWTIRLLCSTQPSLFIPYLFVTSTVHCNLNLLYTQLLASTSILQCPMSSTPWMTSLNSLLCPSPIHPYTTPSTRTNHSSILLYSPVIAHSMPVGHPYHPLHLNFSPILSVTITSIL